MNFVSSEEYAAGDFLLKVSEEHSVKWQSWLSTGAGGSVSPVVFPDATEQTKSTGRHSCSVFGCPYGPRTWSPAATTPPACL